MQRVRKRQVRLLWRPTVLTGSMGSAQTGLAASRPGCSVELLFRRVYPYTLPGGPFDSGASREGLREPSAHVTRNHAMNAIEVVRRYNQAWNGRDANAIVALFAEGGTYSNPHAGQGLTVEAIANYAKAVWAAFPDVTFELVGSAKSRRARSRMSG